MSLVTIKRNIVTQKKGIVTITNLINKIEAALVDDNYDTLCNIAKDVIRDCNKEFFNNTIIDCIVRDVIKRKMENPTMFLDVLKNSKIFEVESRYNGNNYACKMLHFNNLDIFQMNELIDIRNLLLTKAKKNRTHQIEQRVIIAACAQTIRNSIMCNTIMRASFIAEIDQLVTNTSKYLFNAAFSSGNNQGQLSNLMSERRMSSVFDLSKYPHIYLMNCNESVITSDWYDNKTEILNSIEACTYKRSTDPMWESYVEEALYGGTSPILKTKSVTVKSISEWNSYICGSYNSSGSMIIERFCQKRINDHLATLSNPVDYAEFAGALITTACKMEQRNPIRRTTLKLFKSLKTYDVIDCQEFIDALRDSNKSITKSTLRNIMDFTNPELMKKTKIISNFIDFKNYEIAMLEEIGVSKASKTFMGCTGRFSKIQFDTMTSLSPYANSGMLDSLVDQSFANINSLSSEEFTKRVLNTNSRTIESLFANIVVLFNIGDYSDSAAEAIVDNNGLNVFMFNTGQFINNCAQLMVEASLSEKCKTNRTRKDATTLTDAAVVEKMLFDCNRVTFNQAGSNVEFVRSSNLVQAIPGCKNNRIRGMVGFINKVIEAIQKSPEAKKSSHLIIK